VSPTLELLIGSPTSHARVPCFLCDADLSDDQVAYEIDGCFIGVECRDVYRWLMSPRGDTDVVDFADLSRLAA
jgi:hypothetical protein